MKTFIKSLFFTALGMALIIGVQSQNISFQNVLAQITGQFVKPTTIEAQRTSKSSNEPELSLQIKYAIPLGVDLYNIIGSQWNGNTIEWSKTQGLITTIPLQQDINGDGLPDIIYSYNFFGRDNTGVRFLNTSEQFVMINNGQGHDLVYSCTYRSNSTPKYIGNCAK